MEINMKNGIINFDSNWVIWLVFGVFLLFFALFIVYAILSEVKKRKKLLNELESFDRESAPETVRAVLIDKDSEIVYNGSIECPTPKITFYATFKTDRDETLKYEIGSGLFENIEVNQYGLLIIENGRLIDFDTEALS